MKKNVTPFFLFNKCWFAMLLCAMTSQSVIAQEQYSGTVKWDHQGDPTAEMVAGIDRFLLKKTAASIQERGNHWSRDFTSGSAYEKSITKNRERLSWILGLRDERVKFESPELMATITKTAKIKSGHRFDVFRIRWQVLEGVAWEGFLLEPKQKVTANVIAIPDAGQSLEMMIGLQPGIPEESQFAVQLADDGIRVVIPAVISRKVHMRTRKTDLTDREFLYRTSYEMGRHPSGYEVQAIRAIVDWLKPKRPAFIGEKDELSLQLGVAGWGEGGMLAMMSAAVETRIDVALVSGYFGPREKLWEAPIDRNLFGLLEQFGDAEIATLISPRALFIENTTGPEQVVKTVKGAPGKIVPQKKSEVEKEFYRTKKLLKNKAFSKNLHLIGNDKQPEKENYLHDATVHLFVEELLRFRNDKKLFRPLTAERKEGLTKESEKNVIELRQERLVQQITEYNQRLMEQSGEVRRKFFKKLKTSSPTQYAKTIEPYRDYFRKQVIGQFDQELLPSRPRSRKILEHEKWTAYEVMLDVFPEVFAYGILLMPKEIKPGEKRPVVVCQHGLEGTPLQTIQGDHRAYHDFAAKLAEQGVITFSPQNPYTGKDAFRTLQRKANPLGKTLFSPIIAQHEQITRWLGSLPEVNEKKIAFYGLSYGGKSAMRIPPLVSNYCLSICSGDFNDWIRKTVTTIPRYTYVWTDEYEIHEFDLGNTFNYAEMAALIAPKPFMVERGHFDGVAPDEWVAAEFAKVRNLYQAKLKLKDKTEIEWFDGPHAINANGSFRFLSKHLNYPIEPIHNYK